MLNEFFKYGAVTVLGYAFIFFGTAFLVEVALLDPRVAYFIILSLTYLGLYAAHTKIVFKSDFSREKLARYAGTLAAFWAFNNLIYHIMIVNFKLNYLVAILVNTFVFGYLRFYIQRNFVFKKHLP